MRISLLALLLTSVLTPTALAIQCKKAKTPTEKAICGSPTLFALEGIMSEEFKKRKMPKLQAAQWNWVKEREKSCKGQRPCLRKSVLERYHLLCQSKGDDKAEAREVALCLTWNGAMGLRQKLVEAKAKKFTKEDLEDLQAAAALLKGDAQLYTFILRQIKTAGDEQSCAAEARKYDAVAFAEDDGFNGHHLEPYVKAREACGLPAHEFVSTAPERERKYAREIESMKKEITGKLRKGRPLDDFKEWAVSDDERIKKIEMPLERVGHYGERARELRNYLKLVGELKNECPGSSIPLPVPLGCTVYEKMFSEHRQEMVNEKVLVWYELEPPLGNDPRVAVLQIVDAQGKEIQNIEIPSSFRAGIYWRGNGIIDRAFIDDCDGNGSKDMYFITMTSAHGQVLEAECFPFDPLTKRFSPLPVPISEANKKRLFPEEEEAE